MLFAPRVSTGWELIYICTCLYLYPFSVVEWNSERINLWMHGRLFLKGKAYHPTIKCPWHCYNSTTRLVEESANWNFSDCGPEKTNIYSWYSGTAWSNPCRGVPTPGSSQCAPSSWLPWADSVARTFSRAILAFVWWRTWLPKLLMLWNLLLWTKIVC